MKKNSAIWFIEQEAKLSKGKVRDYKLWLLKNFKMYTKVNVKESKKISKRTSSGVKQCYYNCWRALSCGDYRYFEGYVTSKDVPIPLEHAWLINKKNEVIDPTLIINVTKIKNRLGDEYLGLEIPVEYCYKKGFKLKKSGPYILDYFMDNQSGVKK